MRYPLKEDEKNQTESEKQWRVGNGCCDYDTCVAYDS